MQLDEVDIVRDDLFATAYVRGDEAVITFDPNILAVDLAQICSELIRQGYINAVNQWYDTDLDREVLVLGRES